MHYMLSVRALGELLSAIWMIAIHSTVGIAIRRTHHRRLSTSPFNVASLVQDPQQIHHHHHHHRPRQHHRSRSAPSIRIAVVTVKHHLSTIQQHHLVSTVLTSHGHLHRSVPPLITPPPSSIIIASKAILIPFSSKIAVFINTATKSSTITVTVVFQH